MELSIKINNDSFQRSGFKLSLCVSVINHEHEPIELKYIVNVVNQVYSVQVDKFTIRYVLQFEDDGR